MQSFLDTVDKNDFEVTTKRHDLLLRHSGFLAFGEIYRTRESLSVPEGP